MIYGYMRTSKNTQELSLQEDALKKYGVDEIFSEQVSGVKERKQLQVLLNKLQKGDTLVVFEAMKMENEIQAPQDGKIAEVLCSKGENKESGAVLLTME